MKAIIRKEIHLIMPVARGLTKEAKALNISLKKHIETILEDRIIPKKEENVKAQES